MLGSLSGLRVVDLFAGSGALGIEALSRGASAALFVESSRAALAALRANLRELELEAVATVLGSQVERSRAALERLGPFDLALCDPPWARLASVAGWLEQSAPAWLAAGARLVLEHDKHDAPELASLVLRARRSWGDSAVSIFGFEAAQSS
jgi:16S rRNA (guanine966-N2)-methyltransferase